MKKIVKHVIIRFLILLVPYLTFSFVFAENNYQRQLYDLDLIPLYLFYVLMFILLVETVILFFKNKTKCLASAGVFIFMLILYFALPHYQLGQISDAFFW